MKPSTTQSIDRAMILFGLLSVVALAAVALAVYAYATPTSEPDTRTQTNYEHIGSFSYTANSKPSALNPSGTIGPVAPLKESPEAPVSPPAIFTQLASNLTLTYTYQLQADVASNIHGTIAATLELKSQQGWSQKQDLAPPALFEGTAATLDTVVDLTQIALLIKEIEQQTSSSGANFDLIVTSTVSIQGVVNGQELEDAFSTPLTFKYTRAQIIPGEVLAFSESKSLSNSLAVEKHLGAFGLSLPVSLLRLVMLPIAGVLLLAAGITAMVAFLGYGQSEAEMMRARYRSLLVPVSDVESSAAHRISVASVHDLAQLAKRDGRSLFVKDVGEGVCVYFVHDGFVIYQHSTGPVKSGWIRVPAAAPIATSEVPAPMETNGIHANGSKAAPAKESRQWLESAEVAVTPANGVNRTPSGSIPVAKELELSAVDKRTQYPVKTLTTESVSDRSTAPAERKLRVHARNWLRDFLEYRE